MALLIPASRCFVRGRAPGLLRQFLKNSDISTALRPNFGAIQCSATRSISSRPAPRNAPASFISPCRAWPAASSRPRHLPQQQQRWGSVLDSLMKDSWKSKLWQDGYESQFIVTEYGRIPASYTDGEGLRFAAADLTQPEITQIFGAAMGAEEGNRLLRILHGRRVAGTLDHPEFAPNISGYSPRSIAKALYWLRRTVPVEETLNAALRAEEELEQLEEWRAKPKLVIRDRSNPTAGEESNKKDEAKGAQRTKHEDDVSEGAEETFKPDPVYGYSPVDEIRFKNQQEAKKREGKLKEERKARLEATGLSPEEIGTLMAQDPNKIHFPKIRGRVMTEKMKEYQRLGTVSDLELPPEMPFWRRVGPSTLFGFFILALLYAWMVVYKPPKEHERIIKSVPFAVATMIPIVAASLVVFAAWKRPQWWNFMNRYFLLVPAIPRAPSILLSAFSHQQANHLIFNLIPLTLVGIPLCDMIGRATFVFLVFSSAIGANIGSLWFNTITKEFRVSGQGISAVVCAVVCMYFYLCRDEKYRFGVPKEVFGLPGESDPGVPGIALLALFILYNFIGLVKGRKTGIDHVTHFAGIFIGLGYGDSYESGRKMRQKRKEERRRRLAGNQGTMGTAETPSNIRKAEDKVSNAA